MKTQKVKKTIVHNGEKYTYAFNEEIAPMLLVSTRNIPPTGELRFTLPVKDKKTAEQIIKLLEL